jgi:hypothetical protein
MPRAEAVDARQIPQTLVDKGFNHLRKVIGSEIQATKTARATGSSMIEFAPRKRQIVKSVLAAELFPDGETPVLIVAEDESETHETLRKRGPASSSRLSAEQFTLIDFSNLTFLSLDSVILPLGITELKTKMQLPEVVDWLLSQNIIPVDAEYRIITKN